MLEQVFTEGLQSMDRPTLERRKRMEQQKRTASQTDYDPIIPRPLHYLEQEESREVGNEEVKVSLGRRTERAKVLF